MDRISENWQSWVFLPAKGEKRKSCPNTIHVCHPSRGFSLQNRFFELFSCLQLTHLFLYPIFFQPTYKSIQRLSPLPQKSLSEHKGSLLRQHCYLIYSQLLLEFAVLETSLAAHLKLGLCQHGSPIVVEFNMHFSPPFPCPVAPCPL